MSNKWRWIIGLGSLIGSLAIGIYEWREASKEAERRVARDFAEFDDWWQRERKIQRRMDEMDKMLEQHYRNLLYPVVNDVGVTFEDADI